MNVPRGVMQPKVKMFSYERNQKQQQQYPFEGLIGSLSRNNSHTTAQSILNIFNKDKQTNSSENKRLNSTWSFSKSTEKTPKSKTLFSKTNSSSSRQMNKNQSYTTPGSLTSVNTTHSCTIVAVTEGRGIAKGEVGLAAMDLRKPHMMLSQISDTHTYIHSLTKLHYFNPKEIIVPHTFNFGFATTELYKLITDQFPNVSVTSIRRKCFSDSEGLQQIKHLCAPEYANVELQIIHKFYALTAAAALLKYMEQVQFISFVPATLKIEFLGSENSMLIDVETATRLELVESLSGTSDRRSCLLSILNHTNTIGGLRNLRANILQPSCDENIINTRLDCIEELLRKNDLMLSLSKIIRQFVDVDKILWLCMLLPVQEGKKAGEAQINHTLLLKSTMDNLPKLVSTLELCGCQWFKKMKKDLEDEKFSEIKEKIAKVIQDDAHMTRGVSSHFQRCFAVRSDINGLLDVARKSYSEIISDIQDKISQLAEKYNLPLKMNNNITRGFHIVLSVGTKQRSNFVSTSLPAIFIKIQNHGSTISMTTEEIILLDQQAKESLTEIQTMSNIVICGLLQELRSYMSILYKLCDYIAELDMILSLAKVSSGGNYTRPLFDNYMELKDSIHPILECVIPTSPIPNDVFSSHEYNFHIITGPNMGGKSVYIKQIAILQIMAQIGCFIPATKAIFRMTDHLFSRIGFNDNIECNASSYVLEMKEIQYILQTVTPNSLIIVDELCRGTSVEEGTSMAWAICENLLNTSAFTFFTTHFLYLTKLQNIYFNVTNLCTEAKKADDSEELIYSHKILPGVTNIENYGLTLAKNTNLPESVVNLAEDIISVLSKHKKASSTYEQKYSKDFIFYQLTANLIHEIRDANSTDETLMMVANEYRSDYLNFIEKTPTSSHTHFLNESPAISNNLQRIVDYTPGTSTSKGSNSRCNCSDQSEFLSYDPATKTLNINEDCELECPIHDIDQVYVAKNSYFDENNVDEFYLKNYQKSISNSNDNPTIIVCEPDINNYVKTNETSHNFNNLFRI